MGSGTKSVLSSTHLEEGHSCTTAGSLNVFEEVRFILKRNSHVSEQGQILSRRREPTSSLTLVRRRTEAASLSAFSFKETAGGLGKDQALGHLLYDIVSKSLHLSGTVFHLQSGSGDSPALPTSHAARDKPLKGALLSCQAAPAPLHSTNAVC